MIPIHHSAIWTNIISYNIFFQTRFQLVALIFFWHRLKCVHKNQYLPEFSKINWIWALNDGSLLGQVTWRVPCGSWGSSDVWSVLGGHPLRCLTAGISVIRLSLSPPLPSPVSPRCSSFLPYLKMREEEEIKSAFIRKIMKQVDILLIV